jgi:predicted nucleic acid-binding protein
MIVVVNDANILIDLVKLGLEPHFFSLDMDFHTTNLILEELAEDQQVAIRPFIHDKRLTVYACTIDDLLTIRYLEAEKPALSTQDCSALWLAQRYRSLLLTSDNKLRKMAKTLELDVHGHLWVFDKLVDAGSLSVEEAVKMLFELCDRINPKLGLPKAEIEKRLLKWKS